LLLKVFVDILLSQKLIAAKIGHKSSFIQLLGNLFTFGTHKEKG